MPQFDAYSFSGQIFWILFGFLFFYFFILKFYAVNFSEVFKTRQKLSKFKLVIKTSKESVNTFDSHNPFLMLIK